MWIVFGFVWYRLNINSIWKKKNGGFWVILFNFVLKEKVILIFFVLDELLKDEMMVFSSRVVGGWFEGFW